MMLRITTSLSWGAIFSILTGCATLGGASADTPSPGEASATAEDTPGAAVDPNPGGAPVPEQAASASPEVDVANQPALPEQSTDTASDVAAAPAPAEPDPSGAEPKSSSRSPDGIDDETPLPTDANSAAAKAFDQAVQLSQSEPARAAQAFADAASQTTYFYAAWYNAGAAAARAGDRRAAESYYRKALETRPDYGPALTNLAMLLEQTGRATEAQQVISKALREHGDRAGPHLAASAAAFRINQWDTAEKEALKAVRIDERMVPAQHIMARIFMQKERYETARFALENAIDLEPGNALLRLDLGHVLQKLDQDRNALLEYGKAAQLRPDLAEAQQSYGNMLLQNGDPEAALVALQKAVELQPNVPDAHLNFGNALRANKKYKEAVAAYEKAIELDESTAAAYFNLALLYMDNEVEGMEELDQLKQASSQFDMYAEVAGEPGDEIQARLDEYAESIGKRVKRIERRLERQRQRKLIEEAEKAEAAKAASQSGDEGGNAGEGEETPADTESAGDVPEQEGEEK